MRLRTVTAVVVCFLALTTGLGAQERTPESLTYITEDYRPYSYREHGRLKGLAVDLLRLMWQQMGVDEQPIKLYPWARGYLLIQREPNTVLFAMSRTAERETLFKWVCPINTNRHVLIKRADNPRRIDAHDETAIRVGIVRADASGDLLIQEFGDRVAVEAVANFEQNVKKLAIGRLDMVAYGENTAWSVFAAMGLSPEDYVVAHVLSEEQACYAFHRDTPDPLVAQFQQALDHVATAPVFLRLMEGYFLTPLPAPQTTPAN